MHPFIQRLAALFSVIALAATLVSCGGGGGGSTDADQVQGKGTVGILLTDMPADPAMFSAIIARILKVELMPADENGRITLYSAPPIKEFDLLRLRNESIPLAFKDNVPAGKYCKIRLTLEELELVLVDGTSEYPHLPGNGKLDLVARDCFDVVDGEMLTLQLDFDAGKSIHIVEKPGCLNNPKKSCFNFRPVVFVDVLSQDFDSKLVRLEGVITAVNSIQQTLLLCDALPNQGMDNLGCVKVYFGPDSAFFDSNFPWDGAPRAIDDLLVEGNLKKGLTVVGWVRSWAKAENDDDKPAEYHPLLYLDALVAELGKFLQVEGTVVDVGSAGFEMTVSSARTIPSSGPVTIDSGTLDVIYQGGDAGMGINGTRIVSKSGVLLGPGDIEKFQSVQTDGFPESNNSLLKAALVIIDKAVLGTEQVTGVINDPIDSDSLFLVPDEGVSPVCGITTNLLEVALTNNLDIFTVTITNDSSIIEPGGTLGAGQTVGMNGKCVGTSYQTDNVVIVVDKR
jgi:hypothetical protein